MLSDLRMQNALRVRSLFQTQDVASFGSSVLPQEHDAGLGFGTDACKKILWQADHGLQFGAFQDPVPEQLRLGTGENSVGQDHGDDPIRLAELEESLRKQNFDRKSAETLEGGNLF